MNIVAANLNLAGQNLCFFTIYMAMARKKRARHVMQLLLLATAICAAGLWGRTVALADLSTGIQKLDEANEESRAILAKLSDGLYQQSWWQLARAAWHDNAARRFFEVGPLNSTEMSMLANDPDHKGELKEISSYQKFNLEESFKKNIATANFSMTRFIPGTGIIEATMWTAVFQCSATPCTDGNIVPVVIVPDPQNRSNHLMGSVWPDLGFQNMLLNAIPASLHNSSTNSFNFSDGLSASSGSNDDQLTVSYTAYTNLQSCPAASTMYRPLLESVYGLLPGWVCIIFPSENSSFPSLLLSPGSYTDPADSHPHTNPSPGVDYTLSKLNVTKGTWRSAPLQNCSQAAVMEATQPGSAEWGLHFTLCKGGTCIGFDTSDVSCSTRSAGMLALKCVNAALGSIRSGSTNAELELEFGDQNLTCKASAKAGSYCNFAYIYANTSLAGYTNRSLWQNTQGTNTSEFSPLTWVKFHVCVQKLSNMSSGSDYPLPQTLAPDAMKIEAIDSLTSYITAHNTLFTLENGPATDEYTFYGLIVSTALSVITIASPLTRFLLKLACHSRPLRHRALANGTPGCKTTTVVLQMCCNAVVSLAFFLPVLMLAIDETKRQKTFKTWNMAASDVGYTGAASDGTIRVVYLMCGTSKYVSHFGWVIMLVLIITCVSVAGIRGWRCAQIFERYQLLKKRYGAHIQDSNTKESDLQMVMMAIEMSLADHLKLKKELQFLVTSSPEAQLGMSRRLTQARII